MSKYTLSHPLYLDVDMMISFLAYLEGGVVFEGQETLRTEESKQRGAKGTGKVKLPSVANIFGAEGSIEGDINRRLDSTSEYQAARHHTAASLFNYLYARLDQEGSIEDISNLSETGSLKAGQLVQLSGRYIGNSLEEMLDFFTRTLPLLMEIGKTDSSKNSSVPNQKRSGNRSQRQPQAGGALMEHMKTLEAAQRKAFDQGIKVMQHLKEDIDRTPVHDLLVVTQKDLKVVLTASSQYYSGTVNEFLKSGDFNVLGKVTRVLKEGGAINLARRTAMGARNDDTTRDALIQFGEFAKIEREQADPIIKYPAIQVIPMAIFI
ncbi:DUF6414 family protein [Nocardiopsis dassonvillei]|uniref:DUF6414 family protein n=1 Tax=Nocardiopsis dassonvillei TaxID=2014 RepID=UPI003631C107